MLFQGFCQVAGKYAFTAVEPIARQFNKLILKVSSVSNKAVHKKGTNRISAPK